eukprot:TRINITY_DN3267_c0_g1_i1.p1 TRINITY_DN3267_c0_g1~~TRINITY_DN3267_c0_g1_i1.p1  ORF type:complete len:352 (-),score=48.99 TRINITY_DN3267_c0_g1_i1:60-1115(-)
MSVQTNNPVSEEAQSRRRLLQDEEEDEEDLPQTTTLSSGDAVVVDIPLNEEDEREPNLQTNSSSTQTTNAISSETMISNLSTHLVQRFLPVHLRHTFALFDTVGVWKKIHFVVVLYCLPVTVTLLSVLIVDWSNTCSLPLKPWAIIETLLQFVVLAINGVILLPEDRGETLQGRAIWMVASLRIRQIAYLLWGLWTLIGVILAFVSLTGNCSTGLPFISSTTMALSIVHLFSVGLIGLMIFTVTLFLRLYPPDATPRTSRGAPDRLIRTLPIKKFQDSLIGEELGKIRKEDASCAICLMDYETGDEVRYLPCNHQFHKLCVDQWLRTNKACPFCKRDIDATPTPTVAAIPV